MTPPPVLPTEHFTCVVKMLYNLQFVQALAALSAQFSPEERQAWSTSGTPKKVKDDQYLFIHEVSIIHYGDIFISFGIVHFP